MAREIAIGQQDYAAIIEKNSFYVDKTFFIKDWWNDPTFCTVILRPRRFGKTLTMSMMEYFFSTKHAGRADLFEGLYIWEHEEFCALQGIYPVINITLADIKEKTHEGAINEIKLIIQSIFNSFTYLADSDKLTSIDKKRFEAHIENPAVESLARSLRFLSELLYKHHGKKVLIFLDEYDTPMQEAFSSGYWNEIVEFIKNLFNATFKTNPYLEKSLITGITRVSKESIFSDFNHVSIVSTLSKQYETAIGFTEEEVFAAMDEYGLTEKEKVKFWYDGFTFGNHSAMYNPWSIINYLKYQEFKPYWANTSSNGLVSLVLRQASPELKMEMERLLDGKSIKTSIDEQLIFDNLTGGGEDVSTYSLLLASGYMTGTLLVNDEDEGEIYNIRITNHETRRMFKSLIKKWFSGRHNQYNRFVTALLAGSLEEMNYYMANVSSNVFSFFDTGINAAENFYHAFTLGLMVELRDRYIITSNRESGFGRYDIMLEPKNKNSDDAIIIEFKVFKEMHEDTLKDTAAAALKQIEEKQYAAVLMEKGISAEKIRKYGFAFKGKEVLIAE
ncbi:MAG: ATP-binding protein [Selenomonadales bacterium]|nr:ATP-binding protein [Selenomonadales bacterium]